MRVAFTVPKTLKMGNEKTMKKTRTGTETNAMAFYHEKGFVPAFQQAIKFAGKDGHIGTMPDVIAGRLAHTPFKAPGMIDLSFS